ncbi:MAG: hypothetical protein QM831_39395 [Kofleriaceae bacterium]
MPKAGDMVVVRGRGLATFLRPADDEVIVKELAPPPGEPAEEWRVGADSIRPVVTPAEATRALALIGQKVERVANRAIIYHRAHSKSDLEAAARALAMMYSGPKDVPERQYEERLERDVYGELGFVLGLSRKALRAKIRAQLKGEAAPKSLALADRADEMAALSLPERKGLGIDRRVRHRQGDRDRRSRRRPHRRSEARNLVRVCEARRR